MIRGDYYILTALVHFFFKMFSYENQLFYIM